MIKKKILLIVAGTIIGVAVATFSILTLTLNKSANDNIIKLDQIQLPFGQMFNLTNVVENPSTFTFSIENANIATIQGEQIISNACGTTNLIVKKNNFCKTISICVYAKTFGFTTNNINLHLNGNDNSFQLAFLVNGQNYTSPITVTSNTNAVTIENNTITAKNIGVAELSASILGINQTMVATCSVSVQQYIYVESIFNEDININLGQSKEIHFAKFQEGTGDKVNVELEYNQTYLQLKDNTLTALKVGQTSIVVKALSSANQDIVESIKINIQPQLELINYTFKQESTSVQKLFYDTKADGTLTKYTLELTFNKTVTSPITVEGIDVVNLQTEDNVHFMATFTKQDASQIFVNAVDKNNNNNLTECLPVALQQYTQEINYSLVLPNGSNTNTLYLYNQEYSSQANLDGYFDSLEIEVTQDIDISLSANFATLDDNTITAISAGELYIILKAKDGSEFEKRVHLNIETIFAQSINYPNIDEHIFIFDTINVEPSYSPIYALTQFNIEYDQKYFSKNAFEYTAKLCGETTLTIKDTCSNLVHTYNINIVQEYVFFYQNLECTTISATENSTFIVQIYHINFNNNKRNLSADISDINIVVTPNVEYAIHNNNIYFFNFSAETCTLKIVKGEKILTQIDIRQL